LQRADVNPDLAPRLILANWSQSAASNGARARNASSPGVGSGEMPELRRA